MELRPIEIDDFNTNYFQLLGQLSTIDPNSISKNDFSYFVNKLNENHQIFVAHDIETSKIVGTITVLLECKIIHNMGMVCHIEDVVVDKDMRGLGLGAYLINNAIEYAKARGCYKVILDCSEENVSFYKKCGFEQRGAYMYLAVI
jgi:glucosamine-phosphate N-acetyltransferase